MLAGLRGGAGRARGGSWPPAPGLLEDDAAQFGELLPNVARRRALPTYLHGLLLPRERNETLTALAGTEPVVGAQAAPAPRRQWFLSEAAWDAEALAARRLELLIADPATRPADGGVLGIDESGDREDGTQSAAVGHPYLGSVGRVARGLVSVTSLRAGEEVHYPLRVAPYTPARRLAEGLAGAQRPCQPPPLGARWWRVFLLLVGPEPRPRRGRGAHGHGRRRPTDAGRARRAGGDVAGTRPPRRPAERAVAGGAAPRPGPAPSVDHALALVARLVRAAPAPTVPSAA